MKKPTWFLTMLLFSNCIFAGMLSHNKKEIELTKAIKLIEKIQTEDNQNSKYHVSLKFPQIVGENLDASAKSFNKQIQQLITDSVKEFKGGINASAVNKDLPKEAQQNDFYVDYDISVVKPNKIPLISVRFNKQTYYAGHAHPTHQIETFNYDFSTGKQLSLRNLFGASPNYWQVLSMYCRSALVKKIGNADTKWLAEGTAPIPDNYRNWNIRSNGLLITFDEYQVAAYAVGQPEVLIPYKALRQVVESESPIALCVKSPLRCREFKLPAIFQRGS